MNLINRVNPKLRKYIEESIFPLYDLNGPSHGIKHIKEVIERSFQIIEEYEKNEKNPVKINYDLAYIIAAYHDIGDHIDRKKHHIISGEIMFEDNNLDEFISPEEKITAREAIEDHRASNKNLPRSIYGRIVLTADRNDNLQNFFVRRINFCLEHHPEYSKEQVIREIYDSTLKKFGKDGYANEKPGYMPSRKLKEYFETLHRLIEDKEEFCKCSEEYYDDMIKRKKGLSSIKIESTDTSYKIDIPMKQERNLDG